ncbi:MULTISPECIES: hypothetical protein [unclassified Novosphingobium]|nr:MULTISPECIES: hypothetical protein [unclassified Novosphingobium]PTR05122.1 hypothetical protein C8K11_1442 [Novosphingobium sp. GV055]PUA93738.1 hypothetical protein C8K12_1442 [Novosphingobium sp. GV061]PUB10278.1 hypothetical protein C8K14_1462 [Novosphingobium sp. GV079]PUB36441.1 hypothetical protein C8K10_1432 [Novosphingobium sp. GV027]
MIRNIAAWRSIIAEAGITRAVAAAAIALTIITPVLAGALILIVETLIHG